MEKVTEEADGMK